MLKILTVKNTQTLQEIGEILKSYCWPEIKTVDYTHEVESFVDFWSCNNPNGVVYLIKDEDIFVGCIGGYLLPNIYNHNEMLAQLSFIFVSKKYRMNRLNPSQKLYEKFEDWCKQQGVKRILTGVSTKIAENFYSNRNYSVLETTMVKELR